MIVLGPSRVVSYQVRMRAQYCMCTHLTQGRSSEERRKRKRRKGRRQRKRRGRMRERERRTRRGGGGGRKREGRGEEEEVKKKYELQGYITCPHSLNTIGMCCLLVS